MRTTRRALLSALALVAAGSAFTSPASAQATWPSRPVKIVVPYPPGTGPDVLARLVVDGLTKELKANFVVENKPGANAIIGTDSVVKSPADGYSFLLVDRLTLSVNPLLYAPLPYEPRKDIVSISNIADVTLYLIVSSEVPAADFASFVAYAKANPGKITFGSGGPGSIMHLNMELLQAGTGTQFLHVPYKAFAEVIPAMLGGQVQASSAGVEAVLPYVSSGKMKLLAAGAPQRTAIEPNVPTIQEVAGADLILSTSYSMHAKAGTPAEIVSRMNAAVTKVLASPEVQKFAKARGLAAYGTKPQELDAQIATDTERLGKLIRERGIKVQ